MIEFIQLLLSYIKMYFVESDIFVLTNLIVIASIVFVYVVMNHGDEFFGFDEEEEL